MLAPATRNDDREIYRVHFFVGSLFSTCDALDATGRWPLQSPATATIRL